MTFIPNVSSFLSFHDLDPLAQKQCIYFTRQGPRCKCPCSKDTNAKARELHKLLSDTTAALPSLEQLQQYAKLNCCGSGRHYLRIEDHGNLSPLAKRWQDEIQQRRAKSQTKQHSPTVATDDTQDIAEVKTAPLESTSASGASTPEIKGQSKIWSSATGPGEPGGDGEQNLLLPAQHEPRSGLRPRKNVRLEGQDAEQEGSANPTASVQVSRFRPRIERPKGTVASKLCQKFGKDDFKYGRVYVFRNPSFPGFVKIGWTTKQVAERLSQWRGKCGDKSADLVHGTGILRHGQRAEKLAHAELAEDWRVLKQCDGCKLSHNEWFEVSEERATQVVKTWATFLTLANPYCEKGYLKDTWVGIVQDLVKDGAPVSAKTLLERYYKLVSAEAIKSSDVATRSSNQAITSLPSTPSTETDDSSQTSDGQQESKTIILQSNSQNTRQPRDLAPRKDTTVVAPTIPVLLPTTPPTRAATPAFIFQRSMQGLPPTPDREVDTALNTAAGNHAQIQAIKDAWSDFIKQQMMYLPPSPPLTPAR